MARDGPTPEISTEWSDLLAAHPAYEPTSYKALDDLAQIASLASLRELFWDCIRTWVRNDETTMSRIDHPALGGPGHFFIGGMSHALSDELLCAHDIQAVITIHPKDSLAWDSKNPASGLQRLGAGIGSSGVKGHLMIPLEDKANSNLIRYFGQTHDFIREQSAAGRNILIHCKSGRSRSVAVLIAYLQRRFCEETDLAAAADKDEARARMREYREAATAAVKEQRLPVVVIMERFGDLLALYDLELIAHPAYEAERRRVFPAPVPVGRMVPSRVDSILTSKTAVVGPQTSSAPPAARGKTVHTLGGAAVLKICVAMVFFRNSQKPTETVVHQFFEIQEHYFYELEGIDYKGRSNRACKHMCPGLVKFCLGYARDEYGLSLSGSIEQHAVLASGG